MAPRPELALAQRRPPRDSIIFRLIDSPIPVPCGFCGEERVKNPIGLLRRDSDPGIGRWYPLSARAVHPFASTLQDTFARTGKSLYQNIGDALDTHYHDCLRSMSLEVPADSR